MIERPILFNGEMVCAILDGTKTQTRRPTRLQPSPTAHPFFIMESSDRRADRRWVWMESKDYRSARVTDVLASPYGLPGDRLWVRETWVKVPAYRRGDLRWSIWHGLPYQLHPTEGYAAYFRQGFDRSGPERWRPSIHMPRWASRITLEVVRVRVARVADITADEARAEGFPSVAAFMATWHKIYGPDVEWCWVVEFVRV